MTKTAKGLTGGMMGLLVLGIPLAMLTGRIEEESRFRDQLEQYYPVDFGEVDGLPPHLPGPSVVIEERKHSGKPAIHRVWHSLSDDRRAMGPEDVRAVVWVEYRDDLSYNHQVGPTQDNGLTSSKTYQTRLRDPLFLISIYNWEKRQLVYRGEYEAEKSLAEFLNGIPMGSPDGE